MFLYWVIIGQDLQVVVGGFVYVQLQMCQVGCWVGQQLLWYVQFEWIIVIDGYVRCGIWQFGLQVGGQQVGDFLFFVE